MYGQRRKHRTAMRTEGIESSHRGAGVSTSSAPAAPVRSTRPTSDFEEVKRRLEAWLRRLDEQDPWFVLGVHPGADLDEVRARYRELALEHHPDRGGDPVQMRRILHAWDQIRMRLATGRLPHRAATPAREPAQESRQPLQPPGSRRWGEIPS